MDVKNISLDGNRVGVSVIAYSGNSDKNIDRIRGTWFSGFNNNVIRKSTNSGGNGTGATGKEIFDSIRGFGGGWVGNTNVAYEDRITTHEDCYTYADYYALPADIKTAIYNQFKDDSYNNAIVKRINWENSKGIEYVREEETGRTIFNNWDSLGQVDICLRRTYQNTPSGVIITGTEITRLIYIITETSASYYHGGGDGSSYHNYYEYIYRIDGIARTRTELSKRTYRP